MSRHIISKGNYTMDASPAQRAIREALSGNWDEAIRTNLGIIKTSPDDIDALNRLVRAYTQTGQLTKAKTFAKKVLKLDPVNQIAKRSLEKLGSIKKIESNKPENVSRESFLEEPGKTKLVSLIHPGDESVLAGLTAGEAVELFPHPHRVSVTTRDGKYIGRLPDDLAARLRNSIKSGNKYQSLIKSVDGRDVAVFIRGESPTFPPEKIDYVSFTPPELVHKETPEIPFPEEG